MVCDDSCIWSNALGPRKGQVRALGKLHSIGIARIYVAGQSMYAGYGEGDQHVEEREHFRHEQRKVRQGKNVGYETESGGRKRKGCPGHS